MLLIQKKFRPFADRKNIRSPLICSTTHTGSCDIKLQNRFFALEDLGKTCIHMCEKPTNVCPKKPGDPGIHLD